MSDKSDFGRPKAVTKETVLTAIHDNKSTNRNLLARKLKVDPATIYRRLKEATNDEIDEALGVSTEKQLSASMLDSKNGFELFKQLPLVKEYKDKLLYAGKGMSKEKANSRVRILWRLCVWAKKKPSMLQPEDVAALITKIKKGEAKDFTEGKGYDIRIAARRFFTYMGTSGQKLTSMGIGSETYTRKETRAQAKLSQEQRAAVMHEVHARLSENWKHIRTTQSGKKKIFYIPFKDKPELAAAMEIYPKLAYYIGIRASSTFNSCWETAEESDERGHRTKFSGVDGLQNFKKGDTIRFRHLDKGKMGGIAWTKLIIGDFAEEFHAYWVRQGNPEKGFVFAGLKDYQAREFFRDCYEAAKIPRDIWEGTEDNEPMPLHIWRHTAAQDLLAATGWNFEVVAKTLGWESIDVMKKHYGSMPPDVQTQLLLKAMGKLYVETKREFAF